MESMSAKSLKLATKVVFADFVMPEKSVSDANTNFISEQFQEICTHLNIDQVMTSLSPPEQWTGGSMCRVNEMHNEEMQTD